MKTRLSFISILLAFSAALCYASAHRGSDLWLPTDTTITFPAIKLKPNTPTASIIAGELKAWHGLPLNLTVTNNRKSATKKSLSRSLQNEGYTITFLPEEIKVTSPSEVGLLYAAYHLMRLQDSGKIPAEGTISETPAFPLRLLNHWDNLDGTVERGYAGNSIWQWDSLPSRISPKYKEYARANASIGINGAVLNNVNARPEILTTEYLEKVKAISDIFRPYGIRVYLSVNFASPKVIGGLDTADPLDSSVQRWWKGKADEIYRLIPDFGGVLVKANSEGQAGPCDYGRTHADGANMLAKAFSPHNGVVMWRAFVYNPTDEDRAKQAYSEFTPLDGEFLPNVIIQVKNGPIDFQPREPYSPLFGAMKQTPEMVEFQITQEYLGHANHLAYLAPMWKEFFESVPEESVSSVAGVANIGDDANWTGHDFAQANWYAFGRLAWNPELTPKEIAEEWLAQTFTNDKDFIASASDMMLRSREAVVDYMMPLGLHHIFAVEHHYGPQPWFTKEGFRPDWTPLYYHKADTEGIGFNRTKSGSDAVSQYPAALEAEYGNPATCPEKYLLWFHHLPWDYKMKNGNTLWDELCRHYQRGVDEARDFQRIWTSLRPYVDQERYAEVEKKLMTQTRDAMWWRDACLAYFGEISGKPLPSFVEPPLRTLQEFKDFSIPLGICGNAPGGIY